MIAVEEKGLVSIEKINPVAVFADGGIDRILKEIEQKATELNPDISTSKGRKEVASTAYKVSQSKTILDGLGKDLVADWKAKAKIVDESRKKARAFLDALRDRVRQPLTEWEAAEAARVEAERLAKEIEEAHSLAIAEHSLWLRQKEIEAKEAELARQEEARRQKEEAERLEKERIEREERMKREAAEAAQRKAEEAAQAKILEAERKEREAIEAAAKAERERIAAEERAKIEREMAVKEAERKSQEEAERKEMEALAEAARKKAEDEARASNLEHMKKINRAAVAAFVAGGIDEKTAKTVIRLIHSKSIPAIHIEY